MPITPTPIADTPFPTRPDVPDPLVRDAMPPGHPGAALVGRCLVAAIFLASGIHKLADISGTATMMSHQGIPAAPTLALIAGLAETVGGLALVFGVLTRAAAVGLMLFLVPTTLIFHAFWAVPASEQPLQMVNFMKNLAIFGGLLGFASFGPGAISVDARIRRNRALRRAGLR